MRARSNGKANGHAALERAPENPSVATRLVEVERTVTEDYRGGKRVRVFWAEGLCVADDGATLDVRLEGGVAVVGKVVQVDKLEGKWRLRFPP